MTEGNAQLIEIFQSSKDLQWYYHAKATNGEIVVNSEPYTTEEHAQRAADATFPGVTSVVIEGR